MVRLACPLFALALAAACSGGRAAPEDARPAQAPRDAHHQNVTGPHGDHSPHHGGLVLMNGDVHYEVVFDRAGRHEIWFSDAVRSDLPASVATGVTMEVSRPGAPPELLKLSIDDAGEAWLAQGRPLEGDGVMVEVRYALQGVPHAIEVPVVASALR
jgi:hypothetical protein